MILLFYDLFLLFVLPAAFYVRIFARLRSVRFFRVFVCAPPGIAVRLLQS